MSSHNGPRPTGAYDEGTYFARCRSKVSLAMGSPLALFSPNIQNEPEHLHRVVTHGNDIPVLDAPRISLLSIILYCRRLYGVLISSRVWRNSRRQHVAPSYPNEYSGFSPDRA